MKLVQLIYYSKCSSAPENLNSDLIKIAHVATNNNGNIGISGLLLFSNEYFLQVLEGPRVIVNDLYFKIQKDSRHKDSRILLYRDVNHRDFGDWSMGWASDVIAKKDIYFKYCSRRDFTPSDLTGEAGLALLKDIGDLLKS